MPFSNFNFVTELLATGGGPVVAADIQTLVDYGITHIIDCRTLNDANLFGSAAPSLTYLYNPTADDGQPKPVDWFARSISFALPALTNLHSHKVYVHCDAGVNRGPSTCYAILRAWTAMYSDDAKVLIRLHRPIDLVGLRYAADADRALLTLGYVT